MTVLIFDVDPVIEVDLGLVEHGLGQCEPGIFDRVVVSRLQGGQFLSDLIRDVEVVDQVEKEPCHADSAWKLSRWFLQVT